MKCLQTSWEEKKVTCYQITPLITILTYYYLQGELPAGLFLKQYRQHTFTYHQLGFPLLPFPRKSNALVKARNTPIHLTL